MPRSWSGRLLSLFQVVTPAQQAVNSMTDVVVGGTEAPVAALSSEQLGDLIRERTSLQHEALTLAAQVDNLKQEVDLLRATRQFSAGGKNLGARGQLIPAEVISDDSLQWRSSLLLSAGSVQGVQGGQMAASRVFSVRLGANEGARSGLAILRGEVLVGRIEQVGTHTSRVKLLSDVTEQRKVRIGRLTDRGAAMIEGYQWLTGLGRGRMEIRGVDRRLVDPQRPVILANDIVLSDPSLEELPTPMVIGVIESITPDRDNPLLVILEVRTAVDEKSLERVLVYDPN
jgi:cell shape-determining protein MreC